MWALRTKVNKRNEPQGVPKEIEDFGQESRNTHRSCASKTGNAAMQEHQVSMRSGPLPASESRLADGNIRPQHISFAYYPLQLKVACTGMHSARVRLPARGSGYAASSWAGSKASHNAARLARNCGNYCRPVQHEVDVTVGFVHLSRLAPCCPSACTVLASRSIF